MTDHALPIPSPPVRPRTAVVVLSVLVVLLVGASVLAVVLFVGARDERELEARRLDQAGRTLTEAEGRLELTKTANDTVVGRISTLEAGNVELRKCAEPARDSIIAVRNDDDAALRPAVDRAGDNC